MSNINYFEVNVPDDKNPQEYSYTERRAEILNLILRKGSPSGINQTHLAKRYDVSQPMISKDFDVLGDCVNDRIGNAAKLQTRAAFNRIFEDLIEAEDEDGNPDYRAKKWAWDMVMDFNEWLGDMGKQERAPKRSEIDLDADVRRRSSEIAYHVEHTIDSGDQEVPDDLDDAAAIDVEFDADLDVEGFTAEPPDES